jgi:NAD(P)-dependent dehydrogenase (short-subunit alcohol dehydrogenase family)
MYKTDLTGKVAIVTGASRGIGLANARMLAEHGAAVVLNARDEVALTQVVTDIRRSGARAIGVAGDVVLDGTQRRLVDAAVQGFGGLDIAINNAGVLGPIGPLSDIEPHAWWQVLDTNLTSAYLGARRQIPAMLARGGGAIVFTSSFVGTSVGLPGMAAYGAAKAGLMGLVKGITADHGAQGIRANALLPGGVDTDMAGNQAQKDWAAGLHALRRIARPEEIAAAALFLVSPMASFVAGAALFADSAVK